MDMLDQQLLLAQYNEARRNARQQQQVDRCKLIALPVYKPRKHAKQFGTFVLLCVAWVVTVDQVVPLTETQRTEPTCNATSPPGTDTAIYAAPTTGQLSGCRGAGGSSFMSLWTFRFLYILSAAYISQLYSVPFRLHGWWKWAFPGSMRLRRSEHQTMILTWLPTSSCNTENNRNRDGGEAH